MASFIPIDQIVQINPGVISGGSNPLALNGLFIGENPLIPTDKVLEFNSALAVSEYFGEGSYEAELANVYFNGFMNATRYPSALYFAAYVSDPRSAWARATTLKGTSFDSLKDALTGDFFVTISGVKTGGTLETQKIKDATHFTEVASLLTELIGSGIASVDWDSLTSRFMITTVERGKEVTIDQIEGEIAIACGFDQAEVSQGLSSNTLTSVLNFAQQECMNWATFSTVEQATEDEMIEMAKWANNQNKGWLYVLSDNNPEIEKANNDKCMGFQCKDLKWDGVAPIYDPKERATLKAFVMGVTASINWDTYNGRIDFCFKQQTGLEPTVRKGPIALNVLGNGYSFYGAHAGRGPNNTYNFFRDGQMHGSYKHIDTFVNQLFLNNQIRLSVIDLLLSLNSIPYNEEGYSYIRAACLDPIEQAKTNGSIRKGVLLSEKQKAQIISYVGSDVSNDIYAQGWHLSIKDATAQIRQKRGSPPIMFLYSDGGSIQQIMIPSIVVE